MGQNDSNLSAGLPKTLQDNIEFSYQVYQCPVHVRVFIHIWHFSQIMNGTQAFWCRSSQSLRLASNELQSQQFTGPICITALGRRRTILQW